MFFLQSLCDFGAIAIERRGWVEKIQELEPSPTDVHRAVTTRGI